MSIPFFGIGNPQKSIEPEKSVFDVILGLGQTIAGGIASIVTGFQFEGTVNLAKQGLNNINIFTPKIDYLNMAKPVQRIVLNTDVNKGTDLFTF